LRIRAKQRNYASGTPTSFLNLAEEAEPQLRGNPKHWLERLDQEHDNIRGALDWFEETGETQLGLRLAAAATRFWVMGGYPAQGRRRLESALTSDDQQTPARARALNAAALARVRGRRCRGGHPSGGRGVSRDRGGR